MVRQAHHQRITENATDKRLLIDFEFHNPASLDDALQMLERYGDDARLMAGGTALVLQMKQRFAQPAHVIGLRPLAAFSPERSEG